MGARPLGRVIQEHIKKPLADEVLFGKLKKGGTVRVTVETKESGETGLKLESLADELPVKPKKEEPKSDAAHEACGEEARAPRSRSRRSRRTKAQGRRQAQPGAAAAAQGLKPRRISESKKRRPGNWLALFFNLGRADGLPYAPSIVRQLDEILGHDIPILRRLEIAGLARPVLGRPRHEGRPHAALAGRREVAIVGGDHADLVGRIAKISAVPR